MRNLSLPRRRPLVIGTVAVLTAFGTPLALAAYPAAGPAPTTAAAVPELDLSSANRRAPIPGLYDWSRAGYRGGAALPTDRDLNPDAGCQITAAELAGNYQVGPDDGVDDSAGLQRAIDDIRTNCSPGASYAKLSLITLPAGTLNVTRQLGVDADYLVIRGAGSGAGGTRIAYRPDENTRYDTLTDDGSDWDEDGMTHGAGKGGWLWPGRGLFRVQSRGVHTSYASDYASAPANRKDIFEGTVNVHWKAGLKLRGKPGDAGYAARAGDTVVHLASSGSLANFAVGGLVNIRAANTMKFYEQQHALPTDHPLQNLHMRQQLFTIKAVDSTNRTVTIDKPLEYDVPVDSTSDGSAPINGTTYYSKASPIVDPVLGVGFENLAFTQEMPDLNRDDATNNYGNMSPAYQMHGIVFKWAANSWVRGVRAEMTGSHPIVTEEAKNLQLVDNQLDGSWNKGKGGNGYFRGSRVWDSLYAGNVSRNLRHFTFQWSASGNVVIGNDFDSDLNLHGGWERHNLFELNTVTVPYAHRSGNCTANCGDEGGGGPDDSNWFPIWWGAGKKAVKWSGATGAQNVFFNNAMRKQLTSDSAPYQDYYPDRHRIYQFGWSGSGYQHLDIAGTPIADWAHNEQRDYTGGHGVDALKTDPGESLFLKSAGGPGPSPTPTASPSPSPTGSPSPSPATRYETEQATCQGTIDSDHAGYSGTGFCNTTNTVGSYAEWTVTAASAGRHTLTFGYANGSSANRPLDIRVDGTLVTSALAFPPTGSWSSWRTASTTAELTAGTHTIRATATTSGGTANLDYLDVTGATGGEDALLSRGRPATASSSENATLTPDKAVDRDPGTRWASAEGSDPQWIRVDLGATATISRITLSWEAAYGSAYTLEVSNDGTTWTTVKTVTGGDGGVDDHASLTAQGRYVRVQGTQRGTSYGYSLWELEVYGTGGGGGGGDDIIDVSTPAELKAALASVQPGQTIRMAAGTYHGDFLSQRAGTASAPITLTGPRDAILINDGPSGTAPSCPAPTPGWDSGYGFWLADAPHWNLTGFTVAESKKGIVLDNSHYVTVNGVYVHHIEEEGVHFRRSSADGVIRNSRIEQTGLVKPGYGEGVYIGSANSNWGCHGNSGGVDRSDRVEVLDNTIGPNVAAEHIDIKEGTQDGVIRGNTFDGTGLSGQNSADSWVDAKGNNYLLENNTGTFASPGTFANGYETHNPVSGYGCGNVWRGNDSDLGGVGGYAIYISSTSKCSDNPNRVYASNTVRNARNGLTNIPVTP